MTAGAAPAGEIVTGTFSGTGDIPIYYERAAPREAPPRLTVLLSHGYGEHLGRYGSFVDHLVGRGMAVAAIDHRGHGRSGGARGHCLDFAELVADLRLLSNQADTWWPGVPRVLFGHSMGGLVALLYLLRHSDTVRAGALSAPALRLPDEGPRYLRWLGTILGRVAPGMSVRTKVDTTALSRDPAVAPAYDGDPLVHRQATMAFIRALHAAQATANVEASRLRVPILLLQGNADRLVDPAAAREFAARLTCPHQLEILPGYYHELLNEPPPERARVVALLDAWFDRWLNR